MDDRVTLQHRNVCKDGFTVVDQADAGKFTSSPFMEQHNSDMSFTVFLDLPAPWDAVDHAKISLRVRLYPNLFFFSSVPLTRFEPTL